MSNAPRRMALIGMGPTADRYPGPDGFAFVVGARAAVSRWRCGIWVFNDWAVPTEVEPIGNPVPFAKTVILEKLRDRNPAAHAAFCARHEPSIRQEAFSPPVHRWNAWSGPPGLVLAKLFGMDEIYAYGIDMVGAGDCAGCVSASRTEDRWRDERAVWTALVEWIGIPVVRG